MRRTPYTKEGIKRVKCCVEGCTQRGFASWQVCADKGTFRPVCIDHDVQINRMVMMLMYGPTPEVETIMEGYAASLILRK